MQVGPHFDNNQFVVGGGKKNGEEKKTTFPIQSRSTGPEAAAPGSLMQ
jgi:hypothetical protein